MEGLVYTNKVNRVHHEQNIFGLYGSCMAFRKSFLESKKTSMAAKIYLWWSTLEPFNFEFLNTNVDFWNNNNILQILRVLSDEI